MYSYLPTQFMEKTTRLILLPIASIMFFCVFCFTYSIADPGDLDPSFGDGGIVITDISGGSDEAKSIALHPMGGSPDQRFVVAGSAAINGNIDFAVAKYSTIHGYIGTRFGNAGTLTTSV